MEPRADPGVCPHFVLAQECPKMVELETRDPKLTGGLGDCDTSLAANMSEPSCGAQGQFSLWEFCQSTAHTPPCV